MDGLDLLARLAGPALAAIALGWSILQYRLGARKAELTALSSRIEAIATDLAGHKEAGQTSREALGQRLSHLETALSQLPDKDAVHKLDIAVTKIEGSINTQGETLKAVAATARRVEEFLLEAAKGNRK